jgi:hypothetical protein
MEGSVGAPPQRVCPSCARISWATGPRCPYCRARFRRQNVAVFAWLLAGAVVVTLLGVLVMLVVFGHRVNDEVNQRSDKIEREFNDIRKEIDQRLPAAGAVPTTTAFPTPTTTPSPVPTETATSTPTPSPTASAESTSTPTATSTPTIGPEQP